MLLQLVYQIWCELTQCSQPLRLVDVLKFDRSDSQASFQHDLAQAGRMIRFEEFVDFHSQLLGESVRNSSRSIVSDMFQSLHCARYWIYLKLRRKSC